MSVYIQCVFTVKVDIHGQVDHVIYKHKVYGNEGSVMVSRDLHAIGGNGVCRLCLSHYPNI